MHEVRKVEYWWPHTKSQAYDTKDTRNAGYPYKRCTRPPTASFIRKEFAFSDLSISSLKFKSSSFGDGSNHEKHLALPQSRASGHGAVYDKVYWSGKTYTRSSIHNLNHILYLINHSLN